MTSILSHLLTVFSLHFKYTLYNKLVILTNMEVSMAEYGTGCLVLPSKTYEPLVDEYLAEYRGTELLAAAARAGLEVIRSFADTVYPGKDSIDSTGNLITGRLNGFDGNQAEYLAKTDCVPTAAMRERAQACFAGCKDPHTLGSATLTLTDAVAARADSMSNHQNWVRWMKGLPSKARSALTKSANP